MTANNAAPEFDWTNPGESIRKIMQQQLVQDPVLATEAKRAFTYRMASADPELRGREREVWDLALRHQDELAKYETTEQAWARLRQLAQPEIRTDAQHGVPANWTMKDEDRKRREARAQAQARADARRKPLAATPSLNDGDGLVRADTADDDDAPKTMGEAIANRRRARAER